ncbi:MAG TPA: retropepsin-like aspartic protease [Flavisolibacter sp.]|nr:retropepsin-like aspartic protease [Flavisolibacter sp.]
MRILIFYFLALLASCDLQAQSKADSLLEARNFFALREHLAEGKVAYEPSRQLYYQCFLSNFFNQAERSNTLLDSVAFAGRLSEKEEAALLKLRMDNYAKQYQYRLAYQASKTLLSRYNAGFSGRELGELRNASLIWKNLSDAEPQRIAIGTGAVLPYKTDAAGLIRLKVNMNDSIADFVFDTGAGLSVVSRSVARKFGLKQLRHQVKVQSFTGKVVKARLAIAPVLDLGGIVVNNVVFIVFPDEALSFSGGYTIDGIIGFPVIEQMGQVSIEHKAQQIVVPATPQPDTLNNFGLDELLPVINIKYGSDALPFSFDTGAQSTLLGHLFYKRYREMIERTSEPYLMQFGGVGGSREVRAYKVPNLVLESGGRKIVFDSVNVKTIALIPKDKLYFGNLGQDAFRQFDRMVINFRHMYIRFE